MGRVYFRDSRGRFASRGFKQRFTRSTVRKALKAGRAEARRYLTGQEKLVAMSSRTAAKYGRGRPIPAKVAAATVYRAARTSVLPGHISTPRLKRGVFRRGRVRTVKRRR